MAARAIRLVLMAVVSMLHQRWRFKGVKADEGCAYGQKNRGEHGGQHCEG